MKKKYLFIFCLVLVSCSDLRVKREVSSTSKNFKVSFFDPDTLDSEGILLKDFDLNTQLGDLKISTEQYVRRYDAEAKSRKTEELILPKKQQFVEGKNLQKPFNAFDLADKGLYYGVKKILSLISDLEGDSENRELKNYQILQMTRAIMQKYTPPSVHLANNR